MAKHKITPTTRIGDHLKRLMQAHPHLQTQTAMADKTGLAQSTIGRILRNESVPSADVVRKCADALGVTVQEIYTGRAEVDESQSAMRPIKTWEHEDDLPPGEFAFVKRLSLKVAAGPQGESVDLNDDDGLQPQAFRADWIRAKGLKPAALRSTEASGDSMEPTVFDGDAVVLNTADTQVQDKKVYVIWYDGGERIKRLFRLPGGGLRIKSDNEQYAPIDLTADQAQHVRIIGRVVHRAGDGGL